MSTIGYDHRYSYKPSKEFTYSFQKASGKKFRVFNAIFYLLKENPERKKGKQTIT